MKKPTYYPGENISLVMLKPNTGTFPISRTEEGLICLIERGAKGYYPYNSVWDCEVVEVKEKALIVKPLTMEMTPQGNEYLAAQKAKALFAKSSSTHKKEKSKYSYNYQSKNG